MGYGCRYGINTDFHQLMTDYQGALECSQYKKVHCPVLLTQFVLSRPRINEPGNLGTG